MWDMAGTVFNGGAIQLENIQIEHGVNYSTSPPNVFAFTGETTSGLSGMAWGMLSIRGLTWQDGAAQTGVNLLQWQGSQANPTIDFCPVGVSIFDSTIGGGTAIGSILGGPSGLTSWCGGFKLAAPLSGAPFLGEAHLYFNSFTLGDELSGRYAISSQANGGPTQGCRGGIFGLWPDTTADRWKMCNDNTLANVGALALQTSAPTNFGTALGAQTLVASVPQTGNVSVELTTVQSLAGVGCGAGTNTATPTISWTAPGGSAQSCSASCANALSISANGSVDNGATTVSLNTSVLAKAGTAITYTTASVLNSAGCSTVPQYTVYCKAKY